MVSSPTVRELALGFPETDEHPHFEKRAFRVKKKIFVTLDEKNKKATVKLSIQDQWLFCLVDKKAIYPVPGAWGKQGWTIVEIGKIKKAVFRDVLIAAYCTVAPKKLAEKFRKNES